MLILSLAFAFIFGQSAQHFQYLADLLTHLIFFFFEMHGTSFFFHIFICYVKVYFLYKKEQMYSIHFRLCYVGLYYILCICTICCTYKVYCLFDSSVLLCFIIKKFLNSSCTDCIFVSFFI